MSDSPVMDTAGSAGSTPAPDGPVAQPPHHDQPGLGERLGYSLGDLASNLTWTTVSSYLLFFYTDVAVIAAATAGTLMLVARVLDAVFDPSIGMLLDRTRTRFGRARPFLMFGAPVLAVLTVLTFVTPGSGGSADIVWAYVTFILVGLAYSAVNVPYGSLMPMMTRDSGMRMKLSAFRFFGASIGLIVVSTATTPLVDALGGGNQRRGFLLTVTLYAIVGLILFWTVAATAKERVPSAAPAEVEAPMRTALRATLTNGPWVALFVQTLLMFARLGVITGGAIYYALTVVGNPSAISLILLAYSLSALAGSVATPPVLKRLGHRNGIIAGLVASIVLTVLLVLFRHTMPAFLAVFFLSGVVGGFGFVAAPALVSDTVEYQEYRTRQRNEGLLYSGYSFATKVGTALGGAMLAWGLGVIGYRADAHGGHIANGVLWLYLGLPVVLAVLQIVALGFYRLEKRLPEITAELEARHADDGI
ncbi:MFS transporter [Streptomyces sp. NPDC047000]|uniref:MFS transporter n=1 Tax=Streptomyces sp. NPDC047000 TaxID=3155474 RepID=UPI0033EEE532